MFDALDTARMDVPQEISVPPLGRVLVERGHLTEQQLQSALAEQARTGRPLGQVLIALSYVTPTTIAQALATQQGAVVETEFGFATGFDAAPAPAVETSMPPLSPPMSFTETNVVELPQPVELPEPVALPEPISLELPEPVALVEPVALPEPVVLPAPIARELPTTAAPAPAPRPALADDLAAAVSERLQRAEELEREAERLAAELEAAKRAEARVAELETARREAEQRAEALIRDAEA
ncbi:MAG: hypothetical protein JOY72_03820, partial [Actinobacteria bacterium]|nr:hypothetical protein [Actinomycetota bacterium]